jgi:hypothetical protein
MTSSQATSLTERLAALAARSAPSVAPVTQPDLTLVDRVEELVDLTDGLRLDVGTLNAHGDVQASALAQLESRLTAVEAQVGELGQLVRAESARLEAALGQRVEEAALALAETLLSGGSGSTNDD